MHEPGVTDQSLSDTQCIAPKVVLLEKPCPEYPVYASLIPGGSFCVMEMLWSGKDMVSFVVLVDKLHSVERHFWLDFHLVLYTGIACLVWRKGRVAGLEPGPHH